MNTTVAIEGQMNAAERALLQAAVREAPRKPKAVLEVGTWLGGGSTVHLLKALEQNGQGHLWGIEADRSIHDRMIANLRAAVPDVLDRFTPLFGFSQEVIPAWLKEQPPGFTVDVVFLDGGDNPREQVMEFELLAPHIPVGGALLSHDAKLRKGSWMVQYVSLLDNWECRLHDVSAEGLFSARKIAPAPSPQSQRAARQRLRRLKCDPVEVIGAILPRKVCGWIFRALPRKWSLRLGQGRK